MSYSKALHFKNSAYQADLRRGDYHNKMLRPGLCVVHASPEIPLTVGGSRLMDLTPQRGVDYPFQFAMIAFNHVVPVLNLSVFNARRAPAFAFEQQQARDHRRALYPC